MVSEEWEEGTVVGCVKALILVVVEDGLREHVEIEARGTKVP